MSDLYPEPQICRTVGELRDLLGFYPNELAVQGDLELAVAVRFRPAERLEAKFDGAALEIPQRLEIYGHDLGEDDLPAGVRLVQIVDATPTDGDRS